MPDYTTTSRRGVRVPTGANNGVDLAAGLLQMAEDITNIEYSGLPGSPADRQDIIFGVDGSVGINWHLRYRADSASPYKWEFLGGPSLVARVDAAQALAISAGYVDFATVGPTYPVPLAGQYRVRFGARIDATAAPTYTSRLSVRVGSTAAADADAITHTWRSAAASRDSQVAVREITVVAVAAVDEIKLQGRLDGGAATAADRWISITPIRVG